jgi:hypothetical protein
MLVFVHNLLDERSVVHWIDFGTLLGAVRSKEFIPWDADVDVGILERDAGRVRALRPEIEKAGYRVRVSDPAMYHILYSDINTASVDLVLWHERDGVLVSADSPLTHWPGMHDRAAFPRAFVEHLTPVTLYGQEFPAPSPVHDLLREHRYGPGYMTPTRPIKTLRLDDLISSSEMSPAANEMLPRIAERNERLLNLVDSRSLLFRAGLCEAWSGRWMILSGLPLEPTQRHLEAARREVTSSEQSRPALEKLVWMLAWTERAIEEYERPPRFLRLRRVYRFGVRVRRAFSRKLRAFLGRHRADDAAPIA